VRRIVQVAAAGLLLAAAVQEAAKPRAERTWRGRVLGVPYNLNPPTWTRIRASYWSPEDSRLFTDRVIGVGWAINLHRARELLTCVFGALVRDDAPPIRLRRPDRG
jgi:hypothetical protein